jgi:hypothetical protein
MILNLRSAALSLIPIVGIPLSDYMHIRLKYRKYVVDVSRNMKQVTMPTCLMWMRCDWEVLG